ncbi:MAG TPA: heme-binding protein [Thiohalobacter sp.]|nr:heme-binding protein [Thiohalobacter sp.]
MKHLKSAGAALLLGLGMTATAGAEDMLTQKNIGLDLARDIANTAVMDCREKGYQVSAVVVDRNGNLRAALRDDLAPRFTLQISEEKANAVIMGGVDTGTLISNRDDIARELNHIDGLIMMRGGVEIRSGGSLIGAVGVSGAPGGDIDEACAANAVKEYEMRLEFAD